VLLPPVTPPLSGGSGFDVVDLSLIPTLTRLSVGTEYSAEYSVGPIDLSNYYASAIDWSFFFTGLEDETEPYDVPCTQKQQLRLGIAWNLVGSAYTTLQGYYSSAWHEIAEISMIHNYTGAAPPANVNDQMYVNNVEFPLSGGKLAGILSKIRVRVVVATVSTSIEARWKDVGLLLQYGATGSTYTP
jgi:hypothetical protein